MIQDTTVGFGFGKHRTKRTKKWVSDMVWFLCLLQVPSVLASGLHVTTKEPSFDSATNRGQGPQGVVRIYVLASDLDDHIQNLDISSIVSRVGLILCPLPEAKIQYDSQRVVDATAALRQGPSTRASTSHRSCDPQWPLLDAQFHSFNAFPLERVPSRRNVTLCQSPTPLIVGYAQPYPVRLANDDENGHKGVEVEYYVFEYPAVDHSSTALIFYEDCNGSILNHFRLIPSSHSELGGQFTGEDGGEFEIPPGAGVFVLTRNGIEPRARGQIGCPGIPPVSPISDCSSHGTCDVTSNRCICDEGYFGVSCQDATQCEIYPGTVVRSVRAPFVHIELSPTTLSAEGTYPSRPFDSGTQWTSPTLLIQSISVHSGGECCALIRADPRVVIGEYDAKMQMCRVHIQCPTSSCQDTTPSWYPVSTGGLDQKESMTESNSLSSSSSNETAPSYVLRSEFVAHATDRTMLQREAIYSQVKPFPWPTRLRFTSLRPPCSTNHMHPSTLRRAMTWASNGASLSESLDWIVEAYPIFALCIQILLALLMWFLRMQHASRTGSVVSPLPTGRDGRGLGTVTCTMSHDTASKPTTPRLEGFSPPQGDGGSQTGGNHLRDGSRPLGFDQTIDTEQVCEPHVRGSHPSENGLDDTLPGDVLHICMRKFLGPHYHILRRLHSLWEEDSLVETCPADSRQPTKTWCVERARSITYLVALDAPHGTALPQLETSLFVVKVMEATVHQQNVPEDPWQQFLSALLLQGHPHMARVHDTFYSWMSPTSTHEEAVKCSHAPTLCPTMNTRESWGQEGSLGSLGVDSPRKWNSPATDIGIDCATHGGKILSPSCTLQTSTVMQRESKSCEHVCLLMAYYPLGSLQDVLARCVANHAHQRSLPFPLIVAYAEQILAALVEMHRREMYHGNLTPSNVLLRTARCAAAPSSVLHDGGAAPLLHSQVRNLPVSYSNCPVSSTPHQGGDTTLVLSDIGLSWSKRVVQLHPQQQRFPPMNRIKLVKLEQLHDRNELDNSLFDPLRYMPPESFQEPTATGYFPSSSSSSSSSVSILTPLSASPNIALLSSPREAVDNGGSKSNDDKDKDDRPPGRRRVNGSAVKREARDVWCWGQVVWDMCWASCPMSPSRFQTQIKNTRESEWHMYHIPRAFLVTCVLPALHSDPEQRPSSRQLYDQIKQNWSSLSVSE